MKFYSVVLLGLFFLGAGCSQTSSVSEDNSISGTEPTPVAVATTTYIMSSDLLLFSTPSDWSVVQRDGGGVSAIEVESHLGAQMVISVEIAETFEGEPIVYQDWLADNFDFSDAGSTTQINGYTFDVHEIVSEGRESQRIFTIKTQGEDREYFVEIILPIVSGDEFQSIVDSLVLNPSVETRATAQVIR